MNLCPNCASELIPGAKFCHRCGDKVQEKTKACPSCSHQNPYASVFCHHCRYHFEQKETTRTTYQPAFPFDFGVYDLTPQVKDLFFKSLHERVHTEFDGQRHSEYVERFYRSRFQDVYQVRSNQIADEVTQLWERFGKEGLEDIDRRVEAAFDGLLDYFMIQYCPDLHGMALPEAILKYERLRADRIDLWQMIRDFLDLEREEEVVYLDFVTMPETFLANACKEFLRAKRKERVFFVCDLSLRGNCKEGFAMTDSAIYWKMPFDKARQIGYNELQQLIKAKDHLLINDLFFTANPGLNLKLFKLLKKLRNWSAAMSYADAA
jgi:Double zinc ribbon